jgi:uncharacterized protein
MNSDKILELLKLKETRIALVGATNDKTKYGNIIYIDLKQKNLLVFPINPKATTIEGDKSFPDIESLGFKPEIINFVIPPKLALEMIQKLVEKDYDNFWLQPGAESDEILSFLDIKNKTYLANACVMVETR